MKAKSLYRLSWEEAPVWLRCFGILALANFVTFWFAAVFLGGDAVNGKIENGYCFLRNHGHLREVSRAMFLYSRIHCISAMAGLFILVLVVVQFNYRRS
jgi:hypothetical protein